MQEDPPVRNDWRVFQFSPCDSDSIIPDLVSRPVTYNYR